MTRGPLIMDKKHDVSYEESLFVLLNSVVKIRTAYNFCCPGHRRWKDAKVDGRKNTLGTMQGDTGLYMRLYSGL